MPFGADWTVPIVFCSEQCGKFDPPALLRVLISNSSIGIYIVWWWSIDVLYFGYTAEEVVRVRRWF